MEERMINGRMCFVYDVPKDMEIENIALGMLEQNEIKGLLSFRLIQQDTEQYFRYDAEWGVPLAEWLEKVHDRKEVLELTESILEAGEEAEHYLLETDHLCTQIPCLRIEENRCRMPYIPLTDHREGDLLELVRQIWEKIKYAMDEDYTYIFDLLNAFGRKDIQDLAGLRKFIRMIQSGGTLSERVEGSMDNQGGYSEQVMMPPDNPGMKAGKAEIKHGLLSRKTPIPPVGKGMPDLLEPPVDNGKFGNSKKQKKEDKKDKKHHLFASGKKQEKESAVAAALQPEPNPYIEPARKKYYNEIEDNEATVLVIPEEKGYLIRKSNGQEYLLEKDSYVIGSGGQANISIGNNSAVSRKHAQIGKDGNGSFYIKDLNSTNGTFVGGERLVPGDAYFLGDGARIKLANEELRFELRRR
ncbi:MAG: FHA domain-containing protein [Eubacterium sp.]|nr:FHA domain-containing protein [Eubacterium sp.]